MTFYNWNFVTPVVPTFYTYILQPAVEPITIQLNQQVPSLQLNQDVKNSDILDISRQHVVLGDNVGVTSIKEESAEECTEVYKDWTVVSVKEEPDEDQDRKPEFELTDVDKTEEWCEIPIKEEVEKNEEKDDLIDEVSNESELKKSVEKSEVETSPQERQLERGKSSKRSKFFDCEYCSYKTNWKGNLTKHVVSRHTALEEIKWLECEHCSYKGKTKDYLKCHLLHVHNISVKWYNCSQCSFKAKLKSLLERHVIVNHTESEQIKWFQCDHCAYKAKLKTNLKQHILRKHTNSSEINWFQCDYCNFKTKRKRNLKFHQLNKHTDYDKIQWFLCEFCPYKFKRKAAMKVHVATMHGGDGTKNKKAKQETREIPVFIDNKLCWKRIVVAGKPQDYSFKCTQCDFTTTDKEFFTKHVLKEHTVTEIKKEDDGIVKKTYKTKDVMVIVDDVPCVRKIIDHSLSHS